MACDDGGGGQESADLLDIVDQNSDQAEGVAGECGAVRMTQYSSSDLRWCGFSRSDSHLPSFVREGMTVAIAEPFGWQLLRRRGWGGLRRMLGADHS